MPQTSSKNSTSTSVRYWLVKSEPTEFSIDDLVSAPKKTTSWQGVRNYQARNMLRDDFRKGDRVLFYHSSCAEPAIVGTATVTKAGYPDDSALDPKHHYYDEKSTAENPRWYAVDIRLEKKFTRPVTLAELRKHEPLADMLLLRRGSRLSVQPLKPSEFDEVVRLSQTS